MASVIGNLRWHSTMRWQPIMWRSAHSVSHIQAPAQRAITHQMQCRTVKNGVAATWNRAWNPPSMSALVHTRFGRQERTKADLSFGSLRWQPTMWRSGHSASHIQAPARRAIAHQVQCRTVKNGATATWNRAWTHPSMSALVHTRFGRQERAKVNLSFGLVLGSLAILSGLKALFDKEKATPSRLDALLNKKPEMRTVEERMELFQILLKAAESEIESANGRDVVLFIGDSDAGKSTLNNFLWGCRMKKENGEIIVDPRSPVQQVAHIGTTLTSCTSLPKRIGEMSLPKGMVTFFDMPGLTDNRGIEVAIANTIFLKQIIEKAHSVRFVLVVEEGTLTIRKGDVWRETVKLLGERFNNTIGKDKNSISVVVTKNAKPIGDIRARIKACALADTSQIDLTDAASVYDPLDPNGRARLLATINMLRAYEGFASHVSMKKDQLWQTKGLGDEIAGRINAHLQAGKLDAAKDKLFFVHSLASLGNVDLCWPLFTAQQAVQKHGQKLVDNIAADKVLKNRIVEFKKYVAFRQQLGTLVNFQQQDKTLRKTINDTKDPRWASWGESYPTPVAAGVTLCLTAGGFLLSPLWLLALVGGGTTVGCAKRQYLPNETERDIDTFFKGI